MSTSYTAFQKQADRSFFPGTTMAAPYTGRSSAAPTEGGASATPEQIRSQEAWTEGFIEGGAGALAGDGYRGVARGALNTTADTIDAFVDPPARLMTSPALLLAHAMTRITGSDKAERKIRKGRDLLLNLWNIVPHAVSSGLRDLASSEALDPKYLTPEAYHEAEIAGNLGAGAAEMALTRNLPGSFWWKYFAPVTMSDAVINELDKAVQEAREHASDADSKRPYGPIVSTAPNKYSYKVRKSTPVLDAAEEQLAKESPEGQAALKEQRRQRNEAFYKAKEQNEAAKQEAKQKKHEQGASEAKAEQMLGAGVGGFAGLVAAHQITKRIPALQKRRILRYLINTLAAGAGGYAAWKLLDKQ